VFDRGSLVAVILCALWCGWVGHSLVGLSPVAFVQSPDPVSPPEAILLAGEAALPEIPEIDFTRLTAAEALAIVIETPQERQWIVAFFLGEQVGHHYGRDLTRARWFSDSLPEPLRMVFYNGLAHTFPWDIEDPAAQVAAIDAAVSEAHRKSAYIGILIRYAMVHGDTPDKVVGFARPFAAAQGVDAVDGVRIGVQQRYRRDPAKALALVARYPDDFQTAMAEEIGWRVGSESGLDPDKVIPMARDLAEGSRPRFFHGACRSAWHPGVSLAALRPLLTALEEAERSQCLAAVGFALAQVGRSSEQVSSMAADLGDPTWAALLGSAHSSFDGTEQGWLNPDLDRPAEFP